MKLGSVQDLSKKLNEIPQRLKQFVVRDVRRNPILGLYLVIGVMVFGYLIYFAGVIYKDITTDEEKRITSTPKVEQEKKAPPTAKPLQPKAKNATPPPAKKVTASKPSSAQPQPLPQAAAKVRPPATEKLDRTSWQRFEFPDSSYISFPSDWAWKKIPAEKNMLYGISLVAPGTNASLKCYGRGRQPGDDLAKSLKETMSRDGKVKIKEETKKISDIEVVEMSGVLANTRMIVSLFDHLPDRYFIVSLVATEKEYERLRSYYASIVDSFGIARKPPVSSVSIENIEQQLRKSIEAGEEYLVGSMVRIKLKNGAKHKGVVIAEDDTSYTLEGFRFGGKYSFKVKKEDIAEISH